MIDRRAIRDAAHEAIRAGREYDAYIGAHFASNEYAKAFDRWNRAEGNFRKLASPSAVLELLGDAP